MVIRFAPPVAPLFVPANRQDRFQKAAQSGTDAVILDLEDAVAAADKDIARNNVIKFSGEIAAPVIIRINAVGTPWHSQDLDALRTLPFAAIMVPKVESAIDIPNIGKVLRENVAIIALIESAFGLAHLSEILSEPRLAMIAFGSVDFALDIGCSHAQTALMPARGEIIWRSRAANKLAPLDGVTTKFDDPSEIKSDAKLSASLGFGGKMAIHPQQIQPIKHAFKPSAELIAWAKNVLATSTNTGVISIGGEMIDAPMIERAQRILKG